jgi:hypothetical protein
MEDRYITGVFLLLLAISGNFIAETLGCQTQKLLTNNMYVKHFMTFMILYFTINLSNSHNHPYENFKVSLSIWVLFILFTRMHLELTIVVFLLLSVLYIIDVYISHYTYQKNKDNTHMIDKLKNTYNHLKKLLFILIIIGFILYFIDKRKEYSKDWNTMKFIFGNKSCKSLQ